MTSRRTPNTVRPLTKSLAKLSSAAAILAALFTSSGHAQTVTWTAGSGANFDWSDALNWDAGEPGAASDVLFPSPIPGIAPNQIITLGAGELANQLSFDDSYTLTGGDLTLTLGVIDVDPSKTATIASALGGGAGLTKTGTGILSLSGTNTFTGAVNVNGGTLVIAADNNLGNGANTLTLASGTLSTSATFTSARAVTLGAGGGTFDVTGTGNLTLSAALAANANALTKSGAGTLTLGAASTRTGTTAINAGTISLSNITALGTGDVTVSGVGSKLSSALTGTQSLLHNVTLTNGGSLSFNPSLTGTNTLQFTGKTLTIGTGGGTIDNGGFALSGAKVLLTAGQLVGTGALTKTGIGTLQISGANNSFSGTATIGGGVMEFQSADSLGTGTTTVTVNSGGEFASSGVGVRHNITLSGGTISNNSATAMTYSGGINVTTNSNVALRFFNTTTSGSNITLSGAITGSGNLIVIPNTTGTPTAQTLTISGNNSGYSGKFQTANNQTVFITGNQSLGTGGLILNGGTARLQTVNLTSPTLGTSGLNATYFNFGTNPTASGNPSNYATDQLYLLPRSFNRTDSNIDLNRGGGTLGSMPYLAVPGFAMNAAGGGVNDGVMWKGLLNITTAGTYIFDTNVDDQDILYIDGILVGSHTANNGANFTNLTGGTNGITLSAGAHSIVYKYSQGTGGGFATLRYNGPDSSNTATVIPASAFSTGSLANQDIGPVTVSASSTLDILSPSKTTNLSLGNATFTVTSPTIDNLTVEGATITAATPTLAPTSGGLIFSGAIAGGSNGLNIAGPYFTEFQAANSYTGVTTVTGGQLRLNNASSSALAGNLTLNAANTNGAIANVRLLQNEQIANTATLTMTQGILDMNGKTETVANLASNGGRITGGGTLNVTNAPTLTAGTIETALAGNWTLNKTGTGKALLSGNNTYTGVTTVTAGTLGVLGGTGLGAGGVGNGTSVTAGAELQLAGASAGTEGITINGTGVADVVSAHGALRVFGGTSTIGSLTTGSASTVRVDSGELIINGALDVTAGALTKSGKGTLTFASNQASIPAVTLAEGALGFSGPQSFGAVAVPAGLAYSFNSDPGAGVTLTANSGSTIIGNYAVNQAFLSRITAGSNGTLALAVDNANNLDLSAGPNVSLGAKGNVVTYSGTLTPNGSTYRLGGGGGRLVVSSVLSGTNGLEVNGEVQLAATNTFTGAITLNAGGKAIYLNDSSFGTSSNVINLNGGTLQILNPSDNTGGGLFVNLGNQLNGGGRIISVGAAGGTIDLVSRQGQGSFAAITVPNGLTGSGALSKTGLGMLTLFSSTDYSGALTLEANSNRLDLRGTGALPNVASVTINQSARLDVDNNSTLGARQFGSLDNRNRLNDAASIALNGGTLRFVGRNVAFAAGSPATSQENFGVTTIGIGQATINSTRIGGGGADMVISNLVRNVGSGTVQFTTDNNTLGQAGDNGRIILSQVNGVAPALNSFLGGWAVVGAGDFAANGANVTIGGVASTATGITAYGQTGGPAYATLTTTAAPGANGWVTGSIGNAAADNALGTPGVAQNFSVGALRLAGAATRAITFANTTNTDTLYVESGGILSDNNNNARTIGATTSAQTRGRLTAGTTTATTPQELFFHNNQNTMTVNSQIIDNPNNAAATVRVVKDLDGTVVLDAGTSTYSGGTLVLRGTLTANNTGALGTGGVTIKNATLNIANQNATSGVGVAAGLPVYTLTDQAQITLTGSGTTVAYTGAGDRFSVAAGSAIYANAGTANFGFNSLTRVASPTGMTGGQVYLEPGAIVKHNLTNAADQATGILTIKNLGTNADLFFSPGSAGGVNQTVTVGAGTPWAGLSSTRTSGETWTTGTIFANSDFTIQGITRDGGVTSFNLGLISSGTTPTQGSYAIVNNSGGAINATLKGQVVFAEDEPVSMPSDLTFLAAAGSVIQPNHSYSLGNPLLGGQAKFVAQAGSVVDPGNFVALGAAANQNTGALAAFQNIPYPLASPLASTSGVTFEAGSRLLLNDPSGIGSATDNSIRFKTDSILDLSTANAFFGRGEQPFGGAFDTTGVANPDQFIFESGVIFRQQTSNVYKLSQFMPQNAVVEIFNANVTLTNQTNPFLIAAVGTPTIAPENITIGSGGMLTNDSADRTITEGRGRIILGNGAVIAPTTQTYLVFNEQLDVQPNANITIGSTKWIDGVPKLGSVQLSQANSNTIPASASVSVADGAQLRFSAQNVWSDNASLSLPTAVTSFPATGATAASPGNGSSLLLDVANFTEVIGTLSGNGAVISNQSGAQLAVGYGVASDFTFGGVFKSTNGQNPSLAKFGASKLTLTGVSDSTGDLLAAQGEVVIGGAAGKTAFNNVRAAKGATITLDNSVNPLNNRLTGKNLAPQGGTFVLKGNDTTPVTETVGTLQNSSASSNGITFNAGYSYLNVTPGAATTTFAATTLENFQSAGTGGQRSGTWVLRSPSVGNLPGTYSAAGVYTPNPGNTTNGLITAAFPNFSQGTTFGVGPGGVILGAAGTPVVAVRPDYLGDTNATGQGTGFMTADGQLINMVLAFPVSTTVTVASSAGLVVGQAVSGTSIPAGTTIASITDATHVVLSATPTNGAAATVGAALNTSGSYMRLLSASEYTSALRDNQTTPLNVKASGTLNTSGDTRIQTLTLTPGTTVNINGTKPFDATPSRLILNSGGLLVQAGSASTINGDTNAFLQSNSGASIFFHTMGDLNVNAKVFSDNALVKTNAGTLNFGAGTLNAFRGSLQIDDGTVNLGANNGFFVNRVQNGFNPNNSLFVNGGTLNLNGNSQVVNVLSNSNPLPGMGGTITSASAATLTVGGASQFSGIIGGAISLQKISNNTFLLTNDNSYTGSTVVRAGTLQLRDSAVLSGTSSVDVNYAALTLDNGYLSNIANRIPAATPVTLRGATVNLNGAAGQTSSQTFNTLTVAEGSNTIGGTVGGAGANEIIVGNLVRPANSGAIVNFTQTNGFLGTAGANTSAFRQFVTNVNGTPLALNDGIVGGWAIATAGNGITHFATYSSTTGIGALSNTGDGYANYTSTDVSTATATLNVNDGGTARTFAVNTTVNSLRAAMGGAAVYTFNSGVGLTIDSGGFISDANQTLSLGAAANAAPGFITSNSGELDVWVQQNTTGINVPITGNIDFVKTGGAALNIRPEGNFTGIVNTSGTNLLTTTNTAGLVVGMPVSGTGVPANSVITAITPGVSFTINNNTSAAVTAVVPVFGNTYTGKTIVNGGTLSLNQGAAGDGTSYVAIPGDLVVQAATVTESNVANQIKKTANVTVGAGGRVNLVSAAGVTETLNSLTFLDGSSNTGNSNGFDRSAAQLTSTLNLTGSTPITATNTNPTTGVPFIGGNLGNIGFTPVSGAATLMINSPVTTTGLAAVGLRNAAAIGAVPTGISEGGLIKAGTGLLVLEPGLTIGNTGNITSGSNNITTSSTAGLYVGMPVAGTGIPAGSYIKTVTPGVSYTISQNATATTGSLAITATQANFNQNASNYDGTLGSLNEVFNLQSGYVRFDTATALGDNSDLTTVQNGAVLLGSNASVTLTGSIKLKDGASLGATINAFTLGNATTTVSNQSVLNIPSGNVNIAAYDYFIPSTNAGNITVNGRLSGAGNINLTGPQITFGSGGGGVFQLGNPILTGLGSNDYSGTINVGINAVLKNQVALVTGNTRTTGNAMGTATINLNGGRLQLRDDTSATVDQSNQTVNYGNNVTLSADSWLDANRQTSGTAANNTIGLGTLTVPSGTKSLTVDSGNGYIVKFSELAGNGTLMKAGSGNLTIDATTAGTASFTLAGPVGRSVGPTFNQLTLPATVTTLTTPITFTAASNSFTNFGVNGFYITPASKTFNVSGTFAVNPNPDNVSGSLAVTSTTAINAGTFQNNGQVGSTGGTATITASTGFTGSGHYVTNGAALNLAGNLGVGTLRAAGNSVVAVTGTSLTGNVDVQSGTVQLAPTANATSSGTIRVFGSAASVASSSTAPIAAVTGTLDLNGTSGTISHTGGITNNGIVKVSAGTTSVSGVIQGSATTYEPGLLEGMILGGGTTNPYNSTAARQANPGNFGIKLEPRMAQTNAVTMNPLTGWSDGQMWVYTGYIKDDDGVFSFAENIDDNAGIWIDGTKVLDNSTFNVVTSTAYSVGFQGTAQTVGANTGTATQNFGPGIPLAGKGSGWHLIEIRVANGQGGAGPSAANGFTANFGLGYKNGIGAFDGTDYIKPIDDGSGSLFVTPVGGKGAIQVGGAGNAAAVTLSAGGVSQTSAITLNGGATDTLAASLKLTGTAASDADGLTVAGATTPVGKVDLATNSTLTIGALTVPNNGQLIINRDGFQGTLVVNTSQTLAATSQVILEAGTLRFNGTGGTAGAQITANPDSVVDVRGSVTGNLAVVGATFTGGGSVVGLVDVQAGIVTPGTGVTPGSGAAILSADSLIANSSTIFDLGIGGSVAGSSYDRVSVSGAVLDLGSATLNLSVLSPLNASDVLTIVMNVGGDTNPGVFGALTGAGVSGSIANGGLIDLPGGYQVQISYFDDASTPAFETTGGNDVSLLVTVPEPGSAMLLLGGLGSMMAMRRRRRNS